MKKLFVILSFITSAVAFTSINDELFYVPKNFPQPVYDFTNNPLSKEKIELGKLLFYDPILSKDNTISCSSCHLSYTAFTHTDHDLSHGIENRIGIRNAPSLSNLAWGKYFMWDGAVHHLDMQALAPISNHDEMDETINNVVFKLQQSKKYSRLFYKAFNDSLVTGENTLKALSQFMLTLISANSKYDKVMQKEAGFVFNEYELKGYELFKTNCASCHKEPLFTNNEFENNGLDLDAFLKDGGRIKITKNVDDSLKFKVPSLRNVEVSYPYMHDGRFKNLQMVLFHYTEGIHQSATLSNQLKRKIVLSEADKNNLIAFLKTLTDDEFLQNPKFQPNRY
ncbi:MAG: cytochrome-c peroxidase [Chitinophagaceae bacterium]